jgi:hypothetical protein
VSPATRHGNPVLARRVCGLRARWRGLVIGPCGPCATQGLRSLPFNIPTQPGDVFVWGSSPRPGANCVP